jgi:hypothetical protein
MSEWIMTKEGNMAAKKGLVVTTAHRGVFFGYGEPTTDKTVRLEQCRMCVYWSADVRGVMGLAAKGPSGSCRVTAAVPSFTVQDVTSIAEATDAAIARWETGPWT